MENIKGNEETLFDETIDFKEKGYFYKIYNKILFNIIYRNCKSYLYIIKSLITIDRNCIHMPINCK